MDTATRPASSNLGGLARSVAKLMRFRRRAAGVVAAGISPEDSKSNSNSNSDGNGIHKLKFPEYLDSSTIFSQSECLDEDGKKSNNQAVSKEVLEYLLATLFARVSAVKVAYAQLQVAQSPYDPETIQVADHQVVSQLKQISQLKHSYHKNQLVCSEGVCALEIQEQNNVIKTYKITTHKLDLDLQKKTIELQDLRDRLQEAEEDNRSLEMKLKNKNPKTDLSLIGKLHFTGLDPTHFLTALRYTVKSIKSFVKLMVTHMEASGWDLVAAAASIEKDVLPSPEHGFQAFKSHVSRIMFSGFQDRNFGMPTTTKSSSIKFNAALFFDEFTRLKRSRPRELLLQGGKHSTFGEFCRSKYRKLVHPKMESGLFGNTDQRTLFCSGEGVPETPFFASFSEMARRMWLLHRLFFSFDQSVGANSIFQVRRGCRFSDVYMEMVGPVEESSPPASSTVGFTVVPGFKFGMTVIQCKVYLARSE